MRAHHTPFRHPIAAFGRSFPEDDRRKLQTSRGKQSLRLMLAEDTAGRSRDRVAVWGGSKGRAAHAIMDATDEAPIDPEVSPAHR
jgi:hypothetical protein